MKVTETRTSITISEINNQDTLNSIAAVCKNIGCNALSLGPNAVVITGLPAKLACFGSKLALAMHKTWC